MTFWIPQKPLCPTEVGGAKHGARPACLCSLLQATASAQGTWSPLLKTEPEGSGGYMRTQIIVTALQGALPERQRAVMMPSCSCCPKQKQGSVSSKAPTFGWNLCSSSPLVQEMGRMRMAVAWQPPACAPEPLRPRSHLCLCSALLPVGPDGQARRGQWREIASVSALVKPVSLFLRVDSGLQVSVEEEQRIQPCLPGCKEYLWFQPPIHSIQFSHPVLSCPTQFCPAPPRAPWPHLSFQRHQGRGDGQSLLF